ncbi:hypothetical protein BDC45DRAFT_539236 [Circinella umbellata]|nr:hypothetical protein BDC45DRAFT_539236 [Circinella umbellata]
MADFEAIVLQGQNIPLYKCETHWCAEHMLRESGTTDLAFVLKRPMRVQVLLLPLLSLKLKMCFMNLRKFYFHLAYFHSYYYSSTKCVCIMNLQMVIRCSFDPIYNDSYSCDSSSMSALAQIKNVPDSIPNLETRVEKLYSMSTEKADSNAEDGENHYGTRGQPQGGQRGRDGIRGHGRRGGKSKKRSHEGEEQQQHCGKYFSYKAG